MKYVVLLGDGMADLTVPELGNKTPLQAAYKPNMDSLAQKGELGMVRTIPNGMVPGSDVANLSTMGFDPKIYYTGRSPLEAISMGVNLGEYDVALRCNLVTLTKEDEYENKIMLDYSADEITTEEAKELIECIETHLGNDIISFHPGVSYRHCMVWNRGSIDLGLTPPHDISNRGIKNYLPKEENNKCLLDLMKKSYDILTDHPINKARALKGLRPANSIWLWGEGKRPSLPSFESLYNKKGSVISAVDLLKGIGISAGLKVVDVEGATGTIDTNFEGKARAALDELKNGQDFVYIHIEAPDECGHRHEIQNKVRAIELIDQLVLGTLLKEMDIYEDYRIMVLPDHPTPLSTRTHSSDPVPYIIYQKGDKVKNDVLGYDELQAQNTREFVDAGYKLMERFIFGP